MQQNKTTVLVIGGGPSGSLTALLLRKQLPDIDILIIEKQRFPRHHVGEVTLPGWSKILQKAGVLELLDLHIPIKKAGVIFSWGPEEAGEKWTADFRETEGGRPAQGSWHVDRAEFDQLLLREAQQRNIEVLEEHQLVSVEKRERSFLSRIQNKQGDIVEVESCYVVDASGQARVLTRLWKLPLHKHEHMNNFAFYGYWRSKKIMQMGWKVRGRERWAMIVSVKNGWVWHIPVYEDVISVGLVTDKRTMQSLKKQNWVELYKDICQGSDQLEGLLDDAEYIGQLPHDGDPERINAIEDWSYRSEKACGEGWFLVGDAAMFVDPILSSGLTLASHGALLVSNAIGSLIREEVERELLFESYQKTYQDLSSSYVRMAEVWYQRNSRTDSWHWQARRERLRAGGLSLYESNADAFLALCLGAVGSPLDSAIVKQGHSQWGTEFFSWVTTGRLFSSGSHIKEEHIDASQERERVRRDLATRWRKLAFADLKIKDISWHAGERYHTNAYVNSWKRIQYLEVESNAAAWKNMPSMFFPSFPDCPEGILPDLHGEMTPIQAILKLVSSYPPHSKERKMRVLANVEMLLQLQMMQIVAPPEEELAKPSATHPFFTQIVRPCLSALTSAQRVCFEMSWLGDFCRISMEREAEKKAFWVELYHKEQESLQYSTAQTNISSNAVSFEENRFLQKLTSRMRKKESDYQGDFWKELRALAGFGVQVHFTPKQPPQIALF